MTRILAVFLLAAAVASGCKETNRDYCCTTIEACSRPGGDGELHPCTDPDRPFCDNEGTFPDSNGVGRTCIAPPGEPCEDGVCADPDTPVCFEGICVECADAADCPASAPVCEPGSHACISCTEASECAGFTDRPFCEEGACVGCRDGGDCSEAMAPICDPDAAICRGCASGSECASDACDQAGGACVAEEDVLYVEAGGTGSDCTRVDPCGTIQEAVDLAAGSRIWILVAAGSYTETITIAGKTIRILGAGADLSPAALQQPAIDVSGESDVAIEGLRIHDAGGAGDADDGVVCTTSGGIPTLTLFAVAIADNGDRGVDSSGCTLAITQSTLGGNAGGGVNASGGSVTITQSTLGGNAGGGLSLENIDFDVVNNVIVQNGNGASITAGVTVQGSPPESGRFEHNTISANINPGGSVSGLRCITVAAPLTFRNNIVYGNQGSMTQVEGSNCTHRYSLIGPTGEPGPGNLDQAPDFVMAGEGDFHLAAGSPGIDAGEESDVSVDFDGDGRPAGDGPDMGADEVR